LALRVTADRGLAEDAVQEAFTAVWRRASTYVASRGSVRTWILGLVHHKAVDLVRREAARRRPVHADDLDVAESPSPVDLASARDEGRHVRRALRQLPQDQQVLLQMLYLDGLTQREVADRLDVPIGTIKSRTHTAMGALRRALAVAA